MNTIGTYRCETCDAQLLVTIPQVWSRLFTAAMLVIVIVFLVAVYAIDVPSPVYVFALSLIAVSSFVLRYAFGYLHPVAGVWINSRAELGPTMSANVPEDGG